MTQPLILALDVATSTGWAEGRPGGRPFSGVERFGSEGASHDARWAKALSWMHDRLKVSRPDYVFIEAPLPGSHVYGRTSQDVAQMLIGLQAILRTTLYLNGFYGNRVRLVNVGDVRAHFLGRPHRNAKRDIAKKLTIEKCRGLHWIDATGGSSAEGPVADRCDALALWSFACSEVAPGIQETSPIFAAAAE